MAGTFLLYGGTGGIGEPIARLLTACGHQCHLVARDEVKLAALANDVHATYTAGSLLEDGIVNTALMQEATSKAAELGGGAIQGIVYAVGTINLKPVSRLTDADFERDYRLNALGAVKAVQEALPFLKKAEKTASILLFSTVAVAQGFAFHASISMAKGAVEGLTRSLAAELAPKIRVNCIAPSLTRTQLSANIFANEPMLAAISGLHALQRSGEGSDIAPMASLLLTNDGAWITGQVIGVDGGRSSLRTKG